MAAHGLWPRALTRTELDLSDKYPRFIAALANVNATRAYLDGELCRVDDAGLPSFTNTQPAADGERGVRLGLLHLDGRDVSGLAAHRAQGAS
jgi:ATP-dependent DNA ligase